MALTEINNSMPVCTPQSQPGLCAQASSRQLHGNEGMCSAGGSGYKSSCSSVTRTNCSAFPKQGRAGAAWSLVTWLCFNRLLLGKKKEVPCCNSPKTLNSCTKSWKEHQYQYLWETISAVRSITAHQTNITDLGKGWMTLFRVGWL